MAPIPLKIIRTLFGAAEHLAPRLAGRIAFELFARTPDPNALRDSEKRAIERAAGLLAEARRHCLTTRHGRVTAFEFRPQHVRHPLGTVLVLHGWVSRTEHMRVLIEALRAAGYRVVSLDLPGHGQSSGRRLTLVSAVEALHVVGQWFGPFAAIVGHSFGGSVAVNAVAGSIRGVPPLDTDRLVLISAPSSMPALFQAFGKHLNLGRRTYRALAGRVQTLAGQPLENYVGSRQLGSVPVPTLVIHAADDREVPVAHAEDHAAAGGHVRLEWANGLGHRRIVTDPGVAARAVAFLSDQSREVRVA
jgi:pimeloyl-ACP methyl ester carboxylesterase